MKFKDAKFHQCGKVGHIKTASLTLKKAAGRNAQSKHKDIKHVQEIVNKDFKNMPALTFS